MKFDNTEDYLNTGYLVGFPRNLEFFVSDLFFWGRLLGKVFCLLCGFGFVDWLFAFFSEHTLETNLNFAPINPSGRPTPFLCGVPIKVLVCEYFQTLLVLSQNRDEGNSQSAKCWLSFSLIAGLRIIKYAALTLHRSVI